MMNAMSVYIPFPLDGHELCHPLESADFENIILQINGVPRRATWRPITVELVHEDEGKPLVESDAPWLGSHALIFRPAAQRAMHGLLAQAGELLSLQCSEAEVSIFNPTTICDALDLPASSVLRFSNGNIMRVNKYAFKPGALDGVQIFKIPDLRASPTFVRDDFVSAWSASGLKGLGFKRVS